MTTAKESGRGCPLLRASNDRLPAKCSFQAHSSSLQEWGCLISHCVPVLFHQNSLLLHSPGMAPVLVPLRPSNEHIPIVRVPGARDWHGCHSSHRFHLMLQPTLAFWLPSTGFPASTASIAARRSRPVTGLLLPGRLSSSCPR
ncbi:MAG: hypothetical protein EWM73_00124 [Nitrospira sp.]|nr:MAG: hypothetical protein EWM73_00124 [Nitrospira sp.]